MTIVFASAVGEVFLAGGDLGGELLGFAIVPGSVRQEVLLVKGIGLMVGELVVPHNKFMSVSIAFKQYILVIDLQLSGKRTTHQIYNHTLAYPILKGR